MNKFDISISLINYLTLIFFLCFFETNFFINIFLFVFFFKLQYVIMYNEAPNLYIVRGFPGCGKYELIKSISKNSTVINTNIKSYTSCKKTISKQYYKLNRSDIFVTGTLSNEKAFNKYIMLGQYYDYNIKYISYEKPLTIHHMKQLLFQSEIDFDEQLTYYIKQYNRWVDYDHFEVYENVYYESLGDSLMFPEVSKDELDRDLDNIYNSESLDTIKLCANCNKRKITQFKYLSNNCYWKDTSDNYEIESGDELTDYDDDENDSDYDIDSDWESDEDIDWENDDTFVDEENNNYNLSMYERRKNTIKKLLGPGGKFNKSNSAPELTELITNNADKNEVISKSNELYVNKSEDISKKFTLKLKDGTEYSNIKNKFKEVKTDDKFCIIEENIDNSSKK